MTRTAISILSLLIGAMTLPSISAASLFGGTGNHSRPQGGRNWAYEIEPEVLLTQFPTGPIDMSQTTNIWGATWDGADTIFFSSPDGTGAAGPTGDATYLWSYSISAGMSGSCTMGSCYTEIGLTTVPGGNELRMDGLAYENGVLYGWNQDPMNNAPGLYEISVAGSTPTATLLLEQPNVPGFEDIKGIDATGGLIYGVDDQTQSIVFIEPLTMTFGTLASYPVGVTDIDGLAAGDGKLYLVGADAFQQIPTLQLSTLSYLIPTAGVFPLADDFSGAAFFVPEPSSLGLLLLGLGGLFLRQRQSSLLIPPMRQS